MACGHYFTSLRSATRPYYYGRYVPRIQNDRRHTLSREFFRMNEKHKFLVEIVGVIGIVLSLVFVGAELTKVMIDDSFSNDDTAYYVTAGARYGKWTPSITYERFESELSINNASLINDIAGSGLPDSVAATLTSVALGAQASQVEDYSITSVALRYDLDSGVALKADVSRYNDDVSDDNDGTLARVAVNFVF